MYDDLDWDMTETVAEIRELAVSLAEQAISEDKEKVLFSWRIACMMERIAAHKGLLALKDAVESFSEERVPFYNFLKSGAGMLVDGTPLSLILEVMTNDFYTRKQDAVMVLILCFYMLCILEIEERFRAVLLEETDGEPIEKGKEMLSAAGSGFMEKAWGVIPERNKEEFRRAADSAVFLYF